MRFAKLIAILTLAALTLPVFATSALAATGMQVGVEDDWAFTSGAANANRAIKATADLRADVVRVFVMWADVGGANPFSRRAPRKPHYTFRGFEGLVGRALQHHMQVQMVLTGPAPAWATADHRKGPFAPRSPYFGEFARQAALWFRGRVRRFSVWNEPNFRSWLSPMAQAPGIYRALYEQAYRNIKRVDPTDQVLIGETSPYGEGGRAWAPLSFLREVLCSGRCKLRTDGYAHHPYDFYHSPYYRYPGSSNVTISTLSRLSGALRYWALRGTLRDPRGHIPEIYLSEFGYLSSGHSRIDDNRHASYLQVAFSIALRTPHVRELVQYTLVPPRGQYKFFDMSILTSRWQHRKPFNVLAAWTKDQARKHAILVP